MSVFQIGLAYPIGVRRRGRKADQYLEEMAVAHDLVRSLEGKTDLWNCFDVEDLELYLGTDDAQTDEQFFSLANPFVDKCDLLLAVMADERLLLGLVERVRLKGKKTILCFSDRLARCAYLMYLSENCSADVFVYPARDSRQYRQLFPLVERRLREFLTQEELPLLFPTSPLFSAPVRIPMG